MERENAKRARLAERIRATCATTLLTEINNPLAREATITYVRLSRDGSFARVFVDCLTRSRLKIVVNALNAASGVFRSGLAHKLTLYKPPRLVFVADEAIDVANRIDATLNAIARDAQH